MLFLDFLLLIMISVCVGYCFVLNNRIKHLQNSRIEFARMIKELNASIIKAEANVNEMSQLSKITSSEIKAVVEEAKESSNELAMLNKEAEQNLKTLNEYLNNETGEENDTYTNVISARSGEKFSEEDLAELEKDEPKTSYTNNLKNFIHNIVTKTPESSQNLNQTNYYNTLRKINIKK